MVDRLHANAAALQQPISERLAVQRIAGHDWHTITDALHHRQAGRHQPLLELLRLAPLCLPLFSAPLAKLACNISHGQQYSFSLARP